ncbi:hypothetical protein UFOVP1339_15 [uncultured Caudovirales phage]|uniref:Uncharacterized protein n=1 Tax=uncultured Caudovirales phage TaxID=2100421 RepID=A0A6J5RZ83_9CAUD|nr:hypothetical protein UFOVP1339_15 [uncultured Caudovirales phage]
MIEVTVRRFYKCDEGIIVPSHTFILDEVSGALPHMDLGKVAMKVEEDVLGVPCTNLALMDEEEVRVYRTKEEAEDVAAVTA